MTVAMDVEKQHSDDSSFSAPDLIPPENHNDTLTHHTSHFGTVIPNRIFVGGIDYKVNEGDLRHFFSQHGAVKEVNIVIDHSGMSKGYGFVTFETQEEALKILHDANGICLKDKKLNIGQAFRKRRALRQIKSFPVANPNPSIPLPMSCGTIHLTTSTGYPYTYHNGMAYFCSPNMNSPTHHWLPAPPAMLSHSHQPFYQHPTSHHYQCAPNQCQWNVIQGPVPSSPVVYSQHSEYLYQPIDGGSVQPLLPVMEDTMPEFVEARVQQVYPMCPLRTEGMTPIVLQHEPGKNVMFPHSQVHLKPKYCQHGHHTDHHYIPEAREPPDTSMVHTSQPLM